MGTVRRISQKQIAANRRNARKSTGPKTAPGKDASRLNAVSHGLLAQAVVITAGDYQEDPQAFAQLLKELREQFAPVGGVEDFDVQTIAHHYWRKRRAVLYEQGAIRMRTGDLRAREARSREDSFDRSLREGEHLERSARGIEYLIEGLEEIKQEVFVGTRYRESEEWLELHFPDKFARRDEAPAAEQTAAGPVASQDDGRPMVTAIDEELHRLAPLQEEVAAIEALQLESKILVAALPALAAVDKLIRYETANDRALDRALRRLEGLQARRRQPRGTPTEP